MEFHILEARGRAWYMYISVTVIGDGAKLLFNSKLFFYFCLLRMPKSGKQARIQ